MKNIWRQYGFVIATALFLTVFTGYALLDTFVIPKSYAMVEESDREQDIVIVQKNDDSENEGIAKELGGAEESDGTNEQDMADKQKASTGKKGGKRGSGEVSQPESAATTYKDDKISIELTEYQVNDTAVYVADVWLNDASCLKTALANDTYGKNVKEDTSEIAKEHQAILAVNGDFYGARNGGYVIREGTLYRESSSGSEDLVIYQDGSFGIIREGEISARDLLEQGAWNVLSFGPALVTGGEVAVKAGDEVGRAMASNPRTAIGYVEEGHYVFVVSDGRTNESEGLSLSELAQFLKSLGVETAYNLDGGGSSTMVFQDRVVNNPTTGGQRIAERSVSDIVYVGY